MNLYLHYQGFRPTLFKMDVKSAFRLLPLAASNFSLMGVKVGDLFYIDAFLPMGAASSCSIFQAFSDAVAHLIRYNANIDNLLNYLDDFLGVCVAKEVAFQQMVKVDELGDELGSLGPLLRGGALQKS